MCFAYNKEFKAGGIVGGSLAAGKYRLAITPPANNDQRASKRFSLQTQVGAGDSYRRRVLNRLMFEDESI